MAELDCDALQSLADAATDGPWSASFVRVEKDADGRRRGAGVVRGDSEGIVFMSTNGPEILVADAEFIAASRSAIPALLDRVRELEATVRRQEQYIEGLEQVDGEGLKRKLEATEKQLEIRSNDSIAARIARQNVRAVNEWARIVAERDAALSTIAKVEALHRRHPSYTDTPVCEHCKQVALGATIHAYWPCPTVRALGSVPSTGEGNE